MRESEVFRAGLLDGQVALVSGGGTGFGRAIALEYAALGATVVACGRRLEPLEETAALAADGRVLARVCDVREEEAVDALVDGVLADHGRLDVLVNNAGGQFLAPAETISAKGFRTVMRLNAESAWLMTHAAATKAMIPAGRGRVISVTISPHGGLPGMAHSSASRAAVESMTRVLATEWARHGIQLTAIAAGQFATDTFMTKYPASLVEQAAESVPAGRLGRAEEVAWLAAFLASPAGAYMTGSVVTLDGGRDNWIGRWPNHGYADAAGAAVAEQRRP